MKEMMRDTLLQVRGVSHAYGKHRVLSDVTFAVHRGQVVGIIGENGSGKSTLLKIIVGWLRPDRGEVVTEGRMGYCPQDLLLYERLTVGEHIRLFAAAYGINGKNPSPAEDLLGVFQFQQCEGKRVSELSGGMQQRLNLSLAVLHSPHLLILDEPCSGLDYGSYRRFWQYAQEAREAGRSLLIVSHLAYERSQFDVLYTIEDGSLQCA